MLRAIPTRKGYLSPSAITTYLVCPMKYKLSYVLKYPPATTDQTPANIGTYVHYVAKQLYSSLSDNYTPDEVEMKAYRLLRTLRDPVLRPYQNTITKLVENLVKVVKDFRAEWGTIKPVLIETEVKYRGVGGIVDAYFPNGYIVDWKTGTYRQYDTTHQIQGSIYRYLLTRQGYEVKGVKFVYLKYPKVVDIYTLSDDEVITLITEVADGIMKGEFERKRSNLCNYCEYKPYCDFADKCPFLI